MLPQGYQLVQQTLNSQDPHSYKFNKLLERIAHNQLTIQCDNPPYHQVQVLSLIDHALDLKQLIPKDTQDSNKSIRFEGDVQQLVIQLLEQGNISGDTKMEGERNIQIGQGNYNERIEGDYIEGNKSDRSRNINISDNAQVTASGAGAFSLGDISGTVANPHPAAPQMKYGGNRLNRNEMRKKKQDFF